MRVYREQRKWYPSLFLLMPDHLHMLIGFGRGHEMSKVIQAWKRYTATKHGIEWQREFFDHRLRSEENTANKAAYILQNPVRAGLIKEGATWPWILMLD